MKKLLLVVVVLIVLAAAVVLWFFRSLGPADAARLLPGDTVVYASLTDIPRSIMRWPSTTLAQIGVEPELKAFFEKPLQTLGKSSGTDDASQILIDLKPIRFFFAVTSLDQTNAGILVGFQFLGSRASHEKAVARLRKQLQGGKEAAVEKKDYNGTEITSSKFEQNTIYSAAVGHWGLLSNDLTAIQSVIDRATGKSTDVLAGNDRYKQVTAKLSRDPDFLFICQPQKIVATLLATGQSMGAEQIQSQVEQIKKIDAVGFSSKLDGANIRDVIYVQRPNPPEFPSISHSAIKFAGTQTIAYLNAVLDVAQISQSAANPAVLQLVPALQNSTITQLVPQAFDSELSLTLSWPMGQMRPGVLAAIKVKDEAKAQDVFQQLQTVAPQVVVTDQQGVKYLNFPTVGNAFVNPTIALADGFLLAGLDAADIDNALATAKGGTNISTAPDFITAKNTCASANEVFGYVDTRAFFTRTYDTLRPIIAFGANLIPGATDYVDTEKLPSTETIAKHLGPITYAQTRSADGYRVESAGPITANQAFILGGLIGGYFAKPTAQ